MKLDALSLLEEFTLDLLTEIMARNHPYQGDVWDALQVYRQTRQTGDAGVAPYTLDRSTNVASLPADLEKALENMVDSLFLDMSPLE